MTTCGASDCINFSAITAFCNFAASFASLIAAAEGGAEGEGAEGVEEAGFGGLGLRIGCFLLGGGMPVQRRVAVSVYGTSE